ncbi:WD40 repeat [Macleaya cordata]|uniref:WD40 repeat n=1 Tax=Macleaya cordata TaxID=56857 RepID=A0A200QK12_MACCD|nr:WD40 repeat [Macleaya cordata]
MVVEAWCNGGVAVVCHVGEVVVLAIWWRWWCGKWLGGGEVWGSDGHEVVAVVMVMVVAWWECVGSDGIGGSSMTVDTVRGLAVMPGFGVLSASHDGSIRLWELTGQVLMEMVGHTSIIYSVHAHDSGLIVSGSEDCFAKIWKDGVCVQSIEHPGCVWDAKFLENGDIVTACSDGVVRVWTAHKDRIADPVDIESYTSQLSLYKCSRYRYI